jgi:hypothetical protein
VPRLRFDHLTDRHEGTAGRDDDGVHPHVLCAESGHRDSRAPGDRDDQVEGQLVAWSGDTGGGSGPSSTFASMINLAIPCSSAGVVVMSSCGATGLWTRYVGVLPSCGGVGWLHECGIPRQI